MIYKANPYVTSSFTPSPVLEEDALSLTWIIHKYVPLHNAGSEWMAHAINTYLIQNQGFHVNVITNTTPVDEFERVRISVRGALSTNEHVLRHCSVILSHHTQEPNAIKTAYLVKRPIVCLMHDHGRTNFLEEYAALPYKHNIYLINNSQWLEKYYAKHGFQSIIVHPPVYWQEYQTETTHEYVTLINCNMNKGGRLLVEIAKRMHDVEFLGVKGAYNKQYTTKGIQNLTYMDQTPYIKSVYGKTDILLMPSKEESWGRTAIEAMSSGIPVIAHPTPGLLESCGEAGIFCDRDDINAWIDAIRRLKTDKEYYNSVSEKCRARAKELDPEPQLRKLSSWLKSLTWKE
jgi:glycosyltransferase involved in cell wall biosynthesis